MYTKNDTYKQASYISAKYDTSTYEQTNQLSLWRHKHVINNINSNNLATEKTQREWLEETIYHTFYVEINNICSCTLQARNMAALGQI